MLTAFLDACVLYPAPLRDLLISLGIQCPINLRWSPHVHDEWMRNLLANRSDLTRAQAERTRTLMDQAIPDALVTHFEPLIDSLTLPDPDDRHVLAAAIHTKADVIVTWNSKDFPVKVLKHHAIIRQSPDAFIMDVLTAHEEQALEAIRNLRTRLRNPPVSPTDLVDTFANQRLTQVASHLRHTTRLAKL